MNANGLKVLVTGAVGFLGRYVSKEFAQQGYTVTGIGWGKFPNKDVWGVDVWHESEVTLDTLCEFADSPDVIIHCAGGSSVGFSLEHPRQDFTMTVDTTSDLLEYIRCNSPTTKLVYPSTAAVYGQVGGGPIPEESNVAPISPYGVHKAMAESLCRMYTQQYGLSVAVVRLFSIYGAELKKQLFWDACNKLDYGDNIFFGTGEEVRDWLHVRDAATLLRIASDIASDKCPVINGGSGSGTRVRDALERLAAILGRAGVHFTADPKKGDPDSLVADVSKANSLGWQPTFTMEEGIHEYVDWFRSCHRSR